MHRQRNPSPFPRRLETGETLLDLLLVKRSAQGPAALREVSGTGHSRGVLQVLQPNGMDTSEEEKDTLSL